MTKEEVVKILELEPLSVEGGYFKQVYKSMMKIALSTLPPVFKAPSYTASTSIYYLMSGADNSSMHSVTADETWHFYTASSPETYVELLTITPKGEGKLIRLGADLAKGQLPQWTVQGGFMMGARVVSPEAENAWTLTGATVAPSFEYADFVKGDAEALAKLCPEYAELIRNLG